MGKSRLDSSCSIRAPEDRLEADRIDRLERLPWEDNVLSRSRSSLIAVGVLLMSLVPAGAVSASQAPRVTDQLAHLNAATSRPPYLDPARPVALRVKDLLGRMTLEEKVGQMTQAERGAVAGDPSQIATLRLGSVLSGGGSTPTPTRPPPGSTWSTSSRARCLTHAWVSPSSTASTPSTVTATSTAPRSSRTTSASARPATQPS